MRKYLKYELHLKNKDVQKKNDHKKVSLFKEINSLIFH